MAKTGQHSATNAAEASLSDSESRFRTLVANLPGVVYRCALDDSWTMEFISEAVEELVGYPAADFISNRVRSFADVIHPDDRGRVDTAVRSGLASHAAYNISYRLLHADGRIVWVHERGRGVLDANGTVAWLDGVIFDVTEERVAREDLRRSRDVAIRASRVRGDFLARMSHELRTPMNAIVGLTGLALLADLDDETRGRLDAALHAARGMLAGIDDLLDFSSIDAGALVLHPAPFTPADIVRDTVAMMQPKAMRRHLTLTFDAQGSTDLRVLGDGARFGQVVASLLSNGLRFTDIGSVEVALDVAIVEDGWARLDVSIRDSGVGVGDDPVAVEALFDPFVQADGTGARAHNGVGLGLAIARRLARAMGGDVTGRGRPDGGSEFVAHVVLPAAGQASDSRVIPSARHEIRGVRTLLVDDNDLNRRVARAFLQVAGADVIEASDGLTAVRTVAAQPIDVVLMDLHMPGVDGFEAIRRIRALPVGNAVPIITLSALVSPEDRARADAAGADAHVGKPFESEDLYRAIRTTVRSDATLPAGVDPDALERVAGDRALLSELWAELLDQARALVASFDVVPLDAHHLARRAHSLRGAAGMVGCTVLQARSADAERALRRGLDVQQIRADLSASICVAERTAALLVAANQGVGVRSNENDDIG